MIEVEENLPQDNLQWLLGGGGDEKHGVPPFIPAVHGVKEDNGGQNGLTGGQHDTEENGHIVGAVNPGRFLQRRRHLGKVVFQDNDVENADTGGENHHSHLVDESQACLDWGFLSYRNF